MASARRRRHSPVDQLESVGPLHDTAGLPGYPAHDYFAPAGSSVRAPRAGRVVKLSGHNPSLGPPDGVHGPFGWSVYIEHRGTTFYLTHLGTRVVALGQRVRRGERLGSVGDYARWGGVDHVHMGVHRSS